jgi:hypothetical protein
MVVPLWRVIPASTEDDDEPDPGSAIFVNGDGLEMSGGGVLNSRCGPGVTCDGGDAEGRAGDIVCKIGLGVWCELVW